MGKGGKEGRREGEKEGEGKEGRRKGREEEGEGRKYLGSEIAVIAFRELVVFRAGVRRIKIFGNHIISATNAASIHSESVTRVFGSGQCW